MRIVVDLAIFMLVTMVPLAFALYRPSPKSTEQASAAETDEAATTAQQPGGRRLSLTHLQCLLCAAARLIWRIAGRGL